MIRKGTFLILTTLMWVSCSEPLILEERKGELLVECELSPVRNVEAKIFVLGNFKDITKGYIPENAIVKLLAEGVDDEYILKYDSRVQAYTNSSGHLFINPSYKYRIKVSKDVNSTDFLEATSRIPDAQKLKMVGKAEVADVSDAKINNRKSVQLTLSLPNLGEEKSYYRIRAYRKTQSGSSEQLVFDGNNEEPLAFHTCTQDGSTIFDASRVDYDNFTMSFSTVTGLKSGEKFDKIHYYLETLTESTYRYNLSKSKQLAATIMGNSDPVISYKNTSNGYGFLGGSAIAQDSLSF